MQNRIKHIKTGENGTGGKTVCDRYAKYRRFTVLCSKNVFELHGSVHRNYCQKCGKFFDVNYVVNAKGVPYCDECGGIIKPEVVLYEEGLDSQTINGAVRAISKADMLIIGGTSLVVYPAAGMIDYFKGKYLAVLNRDATSRDKQADLCITDPIGEVLGRIRV